MPRSPAPRVSACTLGLTATLALGAALGGPVLALARGRFAHPRPAPPPPAFDRPGGWTDGVRGPEAIQADAIDGLVAVALAVALLLLAGAAINLATLLLARASARRHETTVRAVLGATPGELGRRALAEGALLGLIGGGAGIMLGAAGGALARDAWPGADLFARAHPLAGAAAAAGALALLVLAAAALPAVAAARRNLYGALTVGARATAGPGEAMLRKALAVLQFAGSATLLVGAALLLRGSFPRAGTADPGFDPRDTLTFRVELPAADAAERARMQRALLDGAARLPGVRAVSAATPGAWLGLGPEDGLRTLCDACVWGNLYAPMVTGRARHHAVSPGYFAALRVRVLRGRELRPDDVRAVVINGAFAAKLLPRAEPVGQGVLLEGGWRDEPYVVVGVVDDARPVALGSGGNPLPAVYLPSLANPPRTLALAVRMDGPPERVETAVRDALARAAPGARVSRGVTMERVLDAERAPLRWFAVLGEGLRITLLGAVLGAAGALTLARVLQDGVRGVQALDPAAFGAVAVLLGAVTLAASYAPARRAARVHPNEALRAE